MSEKCDNVPLTSSGVDSNKPQDFSNRDFEQI